jgi:hypothetical protein
MSDKLHKDFIGTDLHSMFGAFVEKTSLGAQQAATDGLVSITGKFGIISISATGGIEVTVSSQRGIYSGYKYHTFTSGGNFVVTAGGYVQVLVVAGGGSGNTLGGGGSGGVVYHASKAVTAGTYSITIGAGGLFATGGGQGQDGGNSVFDDITAVGGGHGQYKNTGIDGGSGAGGSATADGLANPGAGTQADSGGGTGYGENGGIGYTSTNPAGGGGGGASAVGGNAAPNAGGVGGAGINIAAINATTYAGGGGGGGSAFGGAGGAGGGGQGGKTTDGVDCAANTGSGGGGTVDGKNGGDGGSGIVIIKYSTTALTAESLEIYTDSAADPTTIRRKVVTSAASDTANHGVLCPVKKGDYWKIVSTCTLGTCYWIPIGS